MVEPYPLITLTSEQRAYAEKIAGERHKAHPAGNGNSDGGIGDLYADTIGTYAEVAVCLHYGLDYQAHVQCYEKARGPSPDVTLNGWTVSVKGRPRWHLPLDLVVKEHDTRNAAYLLVSVNVNTGQCGLRGWITQAELLTYAPKEWQWDQTRPGATRPGRHRYVPVERLHPCKTPAVSAIQAPGAAMDAARPYQTGGHQ